MGEREVESILSLTSKRFHDLLEQQRVIFIISASTVDGIISSSLLFDSIYRLGGSAVIRCIDSTNHLKVKEKIKDLLNEGHYSYIFLNFDSELHNYVNGLIAHEFFLFINTDANATEQQVLNQGENATFLSLNTLRNNSNLKVISTTSAFVYLLVKEFDKKVVQKSYLPIVAEISRIAVTDKHDTKNVNAEILQTAINLNLLEIKKGLTFVDKQTSPIIDAIQNNIVHFIKGLTWNKQAVIEILKQSEIPFIENKRLRSLAELEDKDYDRIVNSIEKFVEETSFSNKKKEEDITDIKKRMRDKLLTYNYLLTHEESNSILKGAHSFSRVLESCINKKNFGTALAISLGDRSSLVAEIQNQIQADNNTIKKIGLRIFTEKWRFYEDNEILFVNGEGILDGEDIDQFANLMGKSISFVNKIICLRTSGTENQESYKYTLISGDAFVFDLNRITDRIKEFMENHNPLTSDRSNVKLLYDSGVTRIEIIVPIEELEVFLSNIKKIVMYARIT